MAVISKTFDHSKGNHVDDAQEAEHQGLFTTRDMHSIVGDVLGEYSCTWENCRGTLYAGTKGIYFLCSFFLFERKMVLYWDDIRLVQTVNHGIEVVCKSDAVHYFEGMHAPDRVWALLVSMQNEALLDKRSKRITPRASIRRSNSDPWNMSGGLEDLLSDGKELPALLDDKAETLPPRQKQLEHRSLKESVSLPAVIREPPPQDNKKGEEIETVTGRLRLIPTPCRLNDFTGKLHTGEDALYFSGRKFFFDKKKLSIRWEEVLRIQTVSGDTSSLSKRSSDKDCDGVRVITKDYKEYTFLCMDDASALWASLIALHNEKRSKSVVTRQRLHRRTNSDPLQSSQLRLNVPLDSDDETQLDDSSRSGSSRASPVVSIESQWQREKESGELKENIVKDHVLTCSLDRFFEMFVQDDAEYSIARYLEGQKDKGLKTAKWKKTAENEFFRVVNFTHPVNVPLAPPEAAARKEQTFRRFGNLGLIVETKTYVDDVPMADCFYVIDRLLVQSANDEKVSISMGFEITFVKSTMFKGIITKTTKSEFEAFLNKFKAYISKALEEPNEHIPSVPSQVVTEPKPISNVQASIPPSTQVAVILLLFMILLLQLWIMVELRGVKMSVLSLQSSKGIQ